MEFFCHQNYFLWLPTATNNSAPHPHCHSDWVSPIVAIPLFLKIYLCLFLPKKLWWLFNEVRRPLTTWSCLRFQALTLFALHLCDTELLTAWWHRALASCLSLCMRCSCSSDRPLFALHLCCANSCILNLTPMLPVSNVALSSFSASYPGKHN